MNYPLVVFRTDNTIKNHFYSKLRKFIRRIVKILHKEKVFVENNIDPSVYTAERIYKIMKGQQIPYDALSKDSIIDMILKHDINTKNAFHSSNQQKLRKKITKRKCENFYIIKHENVCSGNNLLINNENCNTDLTGNGGNLNNISNHNVNIDMNKFPPIQQQIYSQEQQQQQQNAQNAFISHFNMINNIQQLMNVSNQNVSNNSPHQTQLSMVNNYSVNNPNFTVNFIQNLNNFNNLSNLQNLNNLSNHLNKNNYSSGNLSVKSSSSSDQLNSSINYLTQAKNMINYLNDSHMQENKSINSGNSVNMSRIMPHMNQMSLNNFTLGTLGNNSLSTIQNNFKNEMKNSTNLQNFNMQGEVENQYTDILMNNLLNNPCLNTSKVFLSNDLQSENLKKNISFNNENEFLINADNNNTLTHNSHSKGNTTKSFYKWKSLNSIDADCMFDENNTSNIFQNINMRDSNILSQNFPFSNINTNIPSTLDASNFEKFKNFCEMQQNINIKNLPNTQNAQVTHANQGIKSPNNLTQLGFSVSPKSAFSKNFSPFSKN